MVLALLLFPGPAVGQPLTPPRPESELAAPPTAPPTATPTSTPTSSATATAAPVPEKSEDGPPLLGLMLDAGFPGGLGASLLVRPLWFARFHAGLSHNLLGPGLRAGATLVPFHFPVVPTLTGEYGHAFQSDASGLVGRFARLDDAEKTILRKVGYDYLSAALGIEIGSQRSFAWFFRVGLARVWTRAHDVNAALQQTNPSLTSSDPKVRVTVPTLSSGVYLFF